VLSNRSIPDAPVVPVLTYPDVRRAVAWLETAFGFSERVRIGADHRAQLRAGGGAVIVADEGGERTAPGPSTGVTHAVMVRVEDAAAHCERARAAGARIVAEPEDLPFGERQYQAEDLAGHRWTFSQTLSDVEPESWGGTTVTP
jgi:uncharacterized glyoxalase superfamily protein PhnB